MHYLKLSPKPGVSIGTCVCVYDCVSAVSACGGVVTCDVAADSDWGLCMYVHICVYELHVYRVTAVYTQPHHITLYIHTYIHTYIHAHIHYTALRRTYTCVCVLCNVSIRSHKRFSSNAYASETLSPCAYTRTHVRVCNSSKHRAVVRERRQHRTTPHYTTLHSSHHTTPHHTGCGFVYRVCVRTSTTNDTLGRFFVLTVLSRDALRYCDPYTYIPTHVHMQ